MENYYTQHLIVKVDEVDVFKLMKIEATLKHFQEVAMIHAEMLGNGRNELAKHNAFWVLSRISLKINQLPKLEEEIYLKTWPNEQVKFMFPRNYVITNKDGKTLIEASSIWMIMNSNTRQVEVNPNYVIFNSELDQIKGIKTNKVIFDENKKFKSIEHKIVYSDLDINQHVNNVSYLRWVFDLIDLDNLSSHQVTEVDINYLHELKYHSQLQLDYYFNKNEFVVKGVSEKIDCFMTKIKMEEEV